MILNEEQEMMRDAARAFSQAELKPQAAAWDREAAFPRTAVTGLGELGFLGMLVAPEWEGAGADHVSYALALMEVAEGDGSCSTIMSVHNSVGCMPIARFGSAEQKERFLKPMARGEMLGCFCLTEPHTGSDAAALRTRAVKDGNHWVLSSTKQFITSGREADVAIVFAVTDPEAGKKGISAFIVPTETTGYQVASVEKKLGQKASDTCQIVFDELRLTPDLLLGEEGQGYRIALSNLEGGRIGIAAQSVGMAKAAFEVTRDYARERTAFERPIKDHQAIAFKLADMATNIKTSRS